MKEIDHFKGPRASRYLETERCTGVPPRVAKGPELVTLVGDIQSAVIEFLEKHAETSL